MATRVRKLKGTAGKNPNRVLAAKRAYNALSPRRKALRRAQAMRNLGVRTKSKSKGGHSMASKKKGHRGRKGGFRRKVHAARHTIGKLVKVIAVLMPSAMIGYESYKYFGGGWKAVVPALQDFASCFTGIKIGDSGEAEFVPVRLLAGWGPVLIIGGITYAERHVGVNANPFRAMSAGMG